LYPRPTDRKSNAIPVELPRHLYSLCLPSMKLVIMITMMVDSCIPVFLLELYTIIDTHDIIVVASSEVVSCSYCADCGSCVYVSCCLRVCVYVCMYVCESRYTLMNRDKAFTANDSTRHLLLYCPI